MDLPVNFHIKLAAKFNLLIAIDFDDKKKPIYFLSDITLAQASKHLPSGKWYLRHYIEKKNDSNSKSNL